MHPTDEQRLALVEYQRGLLFHPYTCPYSHEYESAHTRLIPGESEWYCAYETCDYTQQYRQADCTVADFLIIASENGDYPYKYMDTSYS